MADYTPRILAGRYEVGELIGRGGMAEVHVGRDTRLGRTVAIKLLRSDLAKDPAFQTRFRREAQAAASLNHPAIVSVYDTGEDLSTDAQGITHHLPFIIMEYVEGHTLRELMRDGAALPIDEATDITIGVLSALQYAHHAGIVHRDIKPANIMLTVAGQVKVMDFGIARALTETSETVTQTQAVIGTAQYLSPEQARGENVDARSDLYSTGCVLFELLTGRPPFVGDSAVAVAYQHVREQPVPPSTYAPDVPAALDRIVLKALQKDRSLRYSTASEFLADLEAAKHGQAVSAPPVQSLSGEPTQVIAAGGLAAALASTPPTQPAAAAVPPAPAFAPAPAFPQPSPFQAGGILPPPEQVAEQEEEDKAKRKRIIIIAIVAGVAVILLGVLLFWIFRGGEDTDDPVVTPPSESPTPSAVKMVTVPLCGTANGAEFKDCTEPDAIDILEKAGLKAVRADEGENSDTVPAGQVIRFDPKPGNELEEGQTVTYVLSLGKDQVSVPTVAGMSQEDAIDLLEKDGFKVRAARVSEDSATVQKDMVTATDPSAGQVVSYGSDITLHVSSGNTVVPADCVGSTLADCKTLLVDAGLVPGETVDEVTEDQPEGTVLRMEPAASATTPQKTQVKIYVAKAIPTVAVPSEIVGVDRAPAETWLASMGLLSAVTEEYSDTVPAGQVIRTDPPVDTIVREGDVVTLVISKGPENTPTPTPSSPTATPTSTDTSTPSASSSP
ncbi:MAG: Stk1 family PASTA domain-containing Ser/Thr kinase [Bifidobacteriaceae bacterium]|nr:Stk1 family PASTA domain-containing Ser/Thr kinase [Bifidobacteriaceae bacterium]